MLSWPKKATQALRVLFAPLQDVDIYVEDSDYEAFYPTLLRRIVPEHVRIRRVFPLDGRDNLLREAPSIKLKEPQALFIVDGDFGSGCIGGVGDGEPGFAGHDARGVSKLTPPHHHLQPQHHLQLGLRFDPFQRDHRRGFEGRGW